MTPTDTPTAVLAEDEPLLAQALQADLARLWPALRIVAAVGDGLQAAGQALQQRPDVCFFDIRMPGQSGLEAAQALVEDWPEGVAFPLLVFITALNIAGKSLAVDLRSAGVAVAILHPGMVKTDMVGNHGQVEPDDAAKGLLARLDELTLETSGGFWHANGQRLPW